MIKSNFKRGAALLLAFIMFISLFNVLVTPVNAAAETANVVAIAFPRNDDANYSTTAWGHGEMTFVNGWHTGAKKYYSVFAMDSWTGNVCYCIELGVHISQGDSFTKKNENFWNNYPSNLNNAIAPDDIKVLIGRIFEYGYTGTISLSWRSHNEDDANKMAHAIATQLLIWETVIGERDADFNHIAPSGCSAVLDMIRADHPLRSKILSYYKSIESSVLNHTKVPSFMRRSTGKAQTAEFRWNGKEYEAVLTDENHVLGNYTYSSDTAGLRFNVSGDTLTLTADSVTDNAVTITAEKNTAKRKGLIVWSDGVISQSGGKQDTVTFANEVTDPVKGFLFLKASYGSARIIKTSEDGKADGVSFRLRGDGIDMTVVTENGGQIQVDNLRPGVYTVTELTDNRYEPQETRCVTVASGQTSTVTFSNTLKRGDLQVIKSSEDNLVEGVTFHLYGTSLSGIAVDEYAVTDKNGVATFKDVLISGTMPYTIEEVDTAIRYVVPANQTAPVKWKEVTTRNFTNILKKFTATVTKSDREEGSAQGDASLAGAVYGIYKGETLVDKYVTDKNGQFTTKEYVCDNDWTIREITPSEGYLLDTTIHKIGAEPQLYTVEHNQTANDVNEQVIKGNIAIIKHTDDGETKIETPESGATFEIYLKSAGNYTASEEDERDIIVCDENGFGQTKDMPYGVYTVHQTSGWEGRELMKDFDVFIAQNGQTYRYLINNANFESYIKVVKVDAESGKTIPYAGAGFQIYDPTGNLVTMSFTYPTPTTIDTFYTDANGCLVTPEKLEYGKGYSLVEVQAPYGYVLDSTPVYFDVTQDNATEESGVTVIKVDKPNMAQKGTITVEKTGEVFYGVSVSGSEDAEVIYQPIYEIAGLSGAVYEIRAVEDIITPDGTVRFTNGEVVDTVTTDEDGLAKSRELYLGKYEVQEIKAPYGMVLNDEIHTAELVYAGQNVSVTETATSFVNERQKVEISLKKALEASDLFGIGQNGELKNISFGLFAAEELVSASGTSIPADGLIEIVTLDESGNGTVKTDLPMGGYYVKELATDEHYILSDAKYPVTFEYAGQETAKVQLAVNDGEAIENDLIYGSVSGRKVNENGEPLGGALIGLFKYNDTEFTKENALMTATSQKDGSFSFEQIPFGIWYVREIEQPTGFVLNETVYEVNIAENEQVVEIEIVNEFVRGNITLTKVDADFPDNKLTGATFEVYQDNNADGKLDDEDTLIGALTESGAGIYEMKDLLYGHYLVKESKAPDGFLLDTGIYPVFIETDGMTYSVENKADVGFINEAMKGNLKIVKTSSDGKVEGFSFRITGANGYEVTLKTDENGEIFIEGLRIGEYTVSEVADEVSAPYSRPADKKANVMTDSTTIVEMHNVVIDTPKTGDNSKLGLWLALLGASAAGIGVTVYAGVRKKKKEDSE